MMSIERSETIVTLLDINNKLKLGCCYLCWIKYSFRAIFNWVSKVISIFCGVWSGILLRFDIVWEA